MIAPKGLRNRVKQTRGPKFGQSRSKTAGNKAGDRTSNAPATRKSTQKKFN